MVMEGVRNRHIGHIPTLCFNGICGMQIRGDFCHTLTPNENIERVDNNEVLKCTHNCVILWLSEIVHSGSRDSYVCIRNRKYESNLLREKWRLVSQINKFTMKRRRCTHSATLSVSGSKFFNKAYKDYFYIYVRAGRQVAMRHRNVCYL